MTSAVHDRPQGGISLQTGLFRRWLPDRLFAGRDERLRSGATSRKTGLVHTAVSASHTPVGGRVASAQPFLTSTRLRLGRGGRARTIDFVLNNQNSNAGTCGRQDRFADSG
jgi:hypothetical protein